MSSHKSNTHYNAPPMRRRTRNPSFSSTLLDTIYRSIDEEFPTTTHQYRHLDASPSSTLTATASTTTTTRSKHNYTRSDGVIIHSHDFQRKTINLRRAIMIEDWMDEEKQKEEQNQNILQVIQPNSSNNNDRVHRKIVRQKSVPSHQPKVSTTSTSSSSRASSSFFFNTSTSSGSSYGGRQPRPEADFSTCFVPQHYNNNNTNKQALRFPKFSRSPANTCLHFDHRHQPPKRQGRRFITNTKSRALKIYDELKQPISPGGKIANFLNSIFTPKKHNVTVSVSERKSKSTTDSDSAPYSSFSKSSCPSSRNASARGKSSCSGGGAKRSVRFYPLSVIVDEDSKPCGHKCLHEDEPKLLLPVFKFDTANFERIVSNHKTSMPVYSRNDDRLKTEEEEMQLRDADDSDDDDDSYTSSDLFELDNLSSIGIRSYNEELPVYGTTNLETNQAIAKGLIV